MKKFINKLILRIRGEIDTETLIKRGMRVGNNFHRMQNVLIDPGHACHIKIGDNVTLAPRAYLLAHDASMYNELKVAKIGIIEIGNNVFVGANAIILPGVTIGDNVVIGAGAVVNKSIPNNSVAAGNPCKIICSYQEFIVKHKSNIESLGFFDMSYTLDNLNKDRKKSLVEKIEENKIGYIE